MTEPVVSVTISVGVVVSLLVGVLLVVVVVIYESTILLSTSGRLRTVPPVTVVLMCSST